VEVQLLVDGAYPDHTTLHKLKIKEALQFMIKKTKKEKKEDRKVEIKEIKPTLEAKVVKDDEGEDFKLDVGYDLRKEDELLEQEEKGWQACDFEIEERDSETDEPLSASSVSTADDIPVSPPPAFIRQQSYVVVGREQISQLHKKLLDELVERIEIDSSRGVAILRAYDWDLDKAVAAYKTDIKACLKKAGITATEESLKKKPSLERQSSSTEFTCGSCYMEYTLREGYALQCGHRYCMDCWTGWINASFDKGQESVFTECPYGELKLKCKETVPPGFVLKTLSDQKKRDKFQEWQAVAFVKQNTTFKWCPRPGCDKAVEYKKKGAKKVTCACGYSFCFGCGLEDHDPAPCENVQTWMAKCSKESDIFKWLEEQKDNTEVKNCTKCRIVIEKNQGCKHMTCRNCRHEFCWLCFQDWNAHDNNYCTQYVQEHSGEKEAKDRSGDESGDDFRRYQFYFGRWEHYRNSIKFAERIKENAEKRMEALQNMKGSSGSAVHFLLDAVETVISCRKLLEWSYAWSYFLKEEGPVRELFKNHLNNLEEFTEELGELTEQPLDKLMLDSQRTEVINRTRVIEKYKRNIVEFARDHHEQAKKKDEAAAAAAAASGVPVAPKI